PWPWGQPHEAAGIHHNCWWRGCRVAARGARAVQDGATRRCPDERHCDPGDGAVVPGSLYSRQSRVPAMTEQRAVGRLVTTLVAAVLLLLLPQPAGSQKNIKVALALPRDVPGIDFINGMYEVFKSDVEARTTGALAKIAKSEASLDAMGIVEKFPLRSLRVEPFRFLSRQWRDATPAGGAGCAIIRWCSVSTAT